MNNKHPYYIDPTWNKAHQTNAFRVEIFEPAGRCKLRPRGEQAKWLLEHRPFNVSQAWELFGYCVNAPSCEECRIFELHKAGE